MVKYGNDCLDICFGLELVDVFDLLGNIGFKVFFVVVSSGGFIKVIWVLGGNEIIFNVWIKFGGDLFKEVMEVGVKGIVYIWVWDNGEIDIIGVIKENLDEVQVKMLL